MDAAFYQSSETYVESKLGNYYSNNWISNVCSDRISTVSDRSNSEPGKNVGFDNRLSADSMHTYKSSPESDLCEHRTRNSSKHLHTIARLLAKSQFDCKQRGSNKTRASQNPVFWRPFAPSPKPSMPSWGSCKTENNNLLHRGIVWPTIAPSAVKLEASKSSVFKPVKNWFCRSARQPCTNQKLLQSVGHEKYAEPKTHRCEHPGCSKIFVRNEELTRHRRIHSGYKPHQCELCKKRFGRKDHLHKHEKTHLQVSEKKIYLCREPGCGHCYTRSDALTRHKTTAHSSLQISALSV